MKAKTRVLALAVLAVLALCAFGASAAFGQDEAASDATTTTTTPAPAEPAAGDDDADEADEADDNTGEVVAAFLFGLLVIGAFLTYLYRVQDRYFDTTDAMVRLGAGVPQAKDVGALAGLARMAMAATATKLLKVSGPSVIALGKTGASTFSIPPVDPPEDATWSTAPDGIATVEGTGDTVTVQAEKTGVFALSVERGDGVGSVSVTAIEPTPAPSIPFVGAGYGTIVIALALLTVAAVLGIEDVLQGEALATLFGAIAGYIFLKGAAGDSGSGSDTGTNTPA